MQGPHGGVYEGTEGAEGVCIPIEGAIVSPGQTPLKLPGTGPPTRVYMKGPMALATYVAEDGLVEHQWEERLLGLRGFNALV